ncbi:flavin reductase family protein [Bacillus massiliigorillae]|uniref:flavin reductase family protein n=1 Tax=Bacillus massiliigorillae TaxID=1243664 RepID=UPI00039FC504|nr:flavin reductase family protein [Bacillus massiliigorillae]
MDQREFRNTMGTFATGVTIITAKDEEGKNIGLTANAFSSLSLEPPLILVCIDKKSSSIPAFEKGRPFVVNILSEEQENDCWSFAKGGADKFANANYELSCDGVPVLKENLSTIICNVNEVLEGGDHIIVTGLVKEISRNEEKKPLIFYSGSICSVNIPAKSHK